MRRDPIQLTRKLKWPNIWRARRQFQMFQCNCSFSFRTLLDFVGLCWIFFLDFAGFCWILLDFGLNFDHMVVFPTFVFPTMAGISPARLFLRTKQRSSVVSRVLCDQVQSLKKIEKTPGLALPQGFVTLWY